MDQKELLPIPTSPTCDWVSRLFEVGNGRQGTVEGFISTYAKEHPGAEIAGQKEPITFDVEFNDNGKVLEYVVYLKPKKKGDKAIPMRVQLDKGLLDSDSAACKLWQLILGRIIQSCFSIRTKGFVSVDTEIQISIPELVSLEIFKNADVARKCLDAAMKKLQGILIKIKDGTGVSTLPLLSGWKNMRDGHWKVYLNTRIPLWAYLLQGYTRMPIKAFKLSNRAFALYRYLLLLTNMNKKKLQTEGSFNLNVDTLIKRLLPNAVNTQRRTQLIVNPLKRLIDEINKKDVGMSLSVINIVDKDFLSAKLEVKVDPALLTTKCNKLLFDGSDSVVCGSSSVVCGSGGVVCGSGGVVPSLQVP